MGVGSDRRSGGPIVFLTSGTRGDVQPLLALALGLQATGRAVRVVTHAPFRALVEAYGLAFGELDGDLNALMAAPEGRAALVYDGSPLRSLVATQRYLRAARPLYTRMLHSALNHTRDAAGLVVSLPTALFGVQIAAALGIPVARGLLQPVGRTAAFPSPLLPSTRSLGPVLNRLSHIVMELLLWLPWRAELVAWQRAALGGVPHSWRANLVGHARVPTLYGYSAQVAPAPSDWPEWWRITGYWFLDHPAGTQLEPMLEQFLAAGPPPIFIGFGSMGSARHADLAQVAIAGLQQAGQRGVLALDQHGPAYEIAPGCLVIGQTWHDRLFPRLAAAVHHGGAGTTAAALRAGIPALIAPVGVDQWFWGQRLTALGCGVLAPPLHALDATALARGITHILSAETRAQAARLGAAIRSEDGVGEALTTLTALF